MVPEDDILLHISGVTLTSTIVVHAATATTAHTTNTDTTNTITVSPSPLSGTTGEVVPLGLNPIAETFTVTGNPAFRNAGGIVSGTGAVRSVTLPNTAGTIYSLTVSVYQYDWLRPCDGTC